MKATLIKLDTKVIDIPEYRPFYRELVREGLEPLGANYEGIDATFIPKDYKIIDYRMVRISGGKYEENGMYLVNDDMWHTAMPIIDDVIRQEIIPIKKENIELQVKVARLLDVIERLENSWWERLKRKLKSLTPKVRK